MVEIVLFYFGFCVVCVHWFEVNRISAQYQSSISKEEVSFIFLFFICHLVSPLRPWLLENVDHAALGAGVVVYGHSPQRQVCNACVDRHGVLRVGEVFSQLKTTSLCGMFSSSRASRSSCGGRELGSKCSAVVGVHRSAPLDRSLPCMIQRRMGS